MRLWKLIWRSLVFYRNSHLWVMLGTLVSTAVLVGALIIGDSVRLSLADVVFNRLGKTEFALTSGDRFFSKQVADSLASVLKTDVAPVLQSRGIAVVQGGEKRVNKIQVLGVDARFSQIGDIKQIYDDLAADEVIVNERLAQRLKIKPGDEILLRLEKLTAMPKNTPLTIDDETTVARPFTVKKIVGPAEFGSFNLRANQVAPYSAFLSLHSLSAAMKIADRANILLVGERRKQTLCQQEVSQGFKKVWNLGDAGLEFRQGVDQQMIELISNRVFLDEAVVKAASTLDHLTQRIFSYFVNEIRHKGLTTPYSFVSAPGKPIVPADMKDDEIMINEWLARDLEAKPGNEIHLSYFILTSKRELLEMNSTFRIRSIVPLQGPYADRSLMPHLPGLSEQENCSDWDPGIPIDLKEIRHKDEVYWDQYRGTPKAFVTLKKAQNMWNNRFGTLTAIRFASQSKEKFEKDLLSKLDPRDLGFQVHEVKKEGLAASRQSVDFAQLFLGMSFFLIAAALLLTSLLYVFNLEKRSQEGGLLYALGWPNKLLRRMILLEGAGLILIASILGGIGGIVYNQVLLYGLTTVWRGAVGTSALQLHLKASTILTGVAAGAGIAFLTVWFLCKKNSRRSIRDLQRGFTKLVFVYHQKPRLSYFLAFTGVLVVMVILVLTKFETGKDAFSYFFLAGSMLLVSGIAFGHILLSRLAHAARGSKLSLAKIGIRNHIRRPLRSLTLMGLLASGLFIIFTVGANRIGALRDANKRESGTGGFAFYAETSLPILYDLNTAKGCRHYGTQDLIQKGVGFVHFRLKEGDDASCLNLNRISRPQIIAVDPQELSKRGSFTFAETTAEVDPSDPWSVLEKSLSGGMVAGIADRTVIIWGLGKKVGDILTYTDDRGKKFKIKLVAGLANSIFQGNIIISEQVFLQRFPSLDGFRLILVDVEKDYGKDISDKLSWALQDQGIDLVSAPERLAEFNQVENTYLSMFLILGGIAILLGSLGLGIVVWRNVVERQEELALMRAVGFTKKSLLRMLLAEHVFLLIAGVILGIGAALMATLPSILSPGSAIPFSTLVVILLLVLGNGILWTYGAARKAANWDLLTALRNN